MSSKKYVFLLFLITLIIYRTSAGQMRASVSGENVYQATDRYSMSGHANKESRSFTNWDNNDPPVIPANCATCHSTPGFLDFLGEDGSPTGIVDQPAPTGSVITCNACHNRTAHELKIIRFHSEVEVNPTDSEAVCLVCHQTRQSTIGIERTLQDLTDDAVLPNQGFINPHYSFAASTQYGADAHSGFEYPDREYAGFFFHSPGVSTCTDCHNPHDLRVDPQKCSICHVNVVDIEDFYDIRTQKKDFDGNLNSSEGISAEIASLHSRLLSAIQLYAQEVAGFGVVYADQFPYFFIDANLNGVADSEEVNIGNRYNAWTPRMLRAAYNYQFVKKDTGGYVHNSRYIIQLLRDSISDISLGTSQPAIIFTRP